MTQLNMHITPDFERDLKKYMRLRHLPSKAEAIRTAIKEGLEHSTKHIKKLNFESWIGLGLEAPQKKKTKFHSDDDLWN